MPHRRALHLTPRFCAFLAALICFGAAHAASVPAETVSGDRAFAAGDYAAAAEAYLASAQADPEDAQRTSEALTKLANAKTYQAGVMGGEAAAALYEEAAAYAEQAVALAPENPETHVALARALGRLGQFRGVLESLNLATRIKQSLDTALALDPEHDSALHALALWHLNVPWVMGGRREQVRPLFERAIAIRPTVLHHLEYGESLLTLGDPGAARAQLQAALELDPRTAAERAEQARARSLLETL